MRTALALFLVLSACSDPVRPSSPAAAPASSTPQSPAAVSAVAPDDAAYSVVSYQQISSTPPTDAISLGVSSFRGNLTVTVDSMSHYCAPAPQFTTEQIGEDLILTVIQPDAVARCIGSHKLELFFEGIDMRDPLVNRVVLRSPDGEEIASAGTARAR